MRGKRGGRGSVRWCGRGVVERLENIVHFETSRSYSAESSLPSSSAHTPTRRHAPTPPRCPLLSAVDSNESLSLLRAMDRPGVPLDLPTIETALGQFSVIVANGGTRLFEQGRVRSLKESSHANTYEGDVYEKDGKTYQVTLVGHPVFKRLPREDATGKDRERRRKRS
jgi:hypothetical protein